MPLFSVIMATYGRRRHIVPSVKSVLNQSFQDFELIVVGDCCGDDTAREVLPFLSPRVKWSNLAERCGGQSYPNNEGIRLSTGQYVAYLGDDDIWHPDHLTSLATLFESRPELDFGVGGAIYHGPEGSDFRLVTGIFDDDRAPFEHFFPPSSFAHRRDVVDRVGQWLHPLEIRAPADCDFLLRAAHAGMRFGSTKGITVHKFAAGHRYLSHLKQSSDEQEAMLRRMAADGYQDFLESELDKAKAQETFMIPGYVPFEQFEKGQLARQNALNKGTNRPELRPLAGAEVIVQDNLPRALDWQHLKSPHDRVRWVGVNPSPKILLPFKYSGRVKIGLRIAHSSRQALDRLALSVNGQPATATLSPPEKIGDTWEATATLRTELLADDYSVLELRLDEAQRTTGKATGIGVAEIVVQPMGLRHLPARICRALSARLRRLHAALHSQGMRQGI
jgi:GT2 family glycosyltransferase